MREVLFRAKRTDNGEWAEGALFDGENYCIIGQQIKFSPYEENECKIVGYASDRATICQYTGLTDRNGRKIFEGDILSAYLDDYPEDITYVQVTWDGFSWCIREGTKDDVMTAWDCNTFEVCGNIFDNPELLEVAE